MQRELQGHQSLGRARRGVSELGGELHDLVDRVVGGGAGRRRLACWDGRMGEARGVDVGDRQLDVGEVPLPGGEEMDLRARSVRGVEAVGPGRLA